MTVQVKNDAAEHARTLFAQLEGHYNTPILVDVCAESAKRKLKRNRIKWPELFLAMQSP